MLKSVLGLSEGEGFHLLYTHYKHMMYYKPIPSYTGYFLYGMGVYEYTAHYKPTTLFSKAWLIILGIGQGVKKQPTQLYLRRGA